MACSCKVCGAPVDCGALMCERCDDEYSDVYNCEGGHCEVDLKTVAQRVRRIREERSKDSLKEL